jgi:hypothetical protein
MKVKGDAYLPPSRAELVSASNMLSKQATGKQVLGYLHSGYLYDEVLKQVQHDFLSY